MPIHIIIDDDTPVLVELREVRGETEVALNPQDILEHSTEALNNAMGAIYGMVRRIWGTLKEIDYVERPDEVEVEFGLKLTTEANALVVNAGLESQINVTLKWTSTKKE